MLKCKDVTHLLSEGLDRELSMSERVRLEMHLMMCKGCTNFKAQMLFLREACKRYAGDRQDRK